MRKYTLLLLSIFLLCVATPETAKAITRYVDGTKLDNTGDGLSWATAKRDVQAAINDAVSGDQVWVKAGTYMPTMDHLGNATPTDNRTKTIYLKDGVKLYGSFMGMETTLSQRTGSVIVANPTTISGNIGSSGTNVDNCYHVVMSVNDGITTVIDGFIISGGYSTPLDLGTITVEGKTVPKTAGGGMYIESSGVKVNSCGFNSNVAVNGGAVNVSNSSTEFFNCIFATNVAANGGAISNIAAIALKNIKGGNNSNVAVVTPTISILNCQYYGNRALNGNGGALSITLLCNTSITNSTFHANVCDLNGGAMYFNIGTHALLNCSFYQNQATGSSSLGGGIYYSSSASGTLKNTILYGDVTPANSTDANREEVYKTTGNPLTVSYCIMQDYVAPGTSTSNVTFAGGMLNSDPLYTSILNLSIQAGSPAINASDPSTTNPTADITGFIRSGVFDMGAYEYRNICQPTGSTTILTVCDSVEWNGTVYKTSGVYTKTGLINAAGCDSTAALNLTVNYSNSSASIVSVCNSYFWNDSTYKQSGIYTWMGTNEAGCDSTATLYLTILSVTSTYTKTDAACFGSATGSITITPTYGVAPYTYRIGTIAPYVSSNTFTGLRAGNYRISILDANGCAGISDQITILQQPALSATFTKTDAGCYGAADGSLSVTPTNGTSPYQYKLGTSGVYGSSNTFSSLSAGTYRVYFLDANNCTGFVSITIGSSPPITATFTTTDNICPRQSLGSFTITSASGTAPFTYRLGTTGTYGTSNTFSGLRAGNYRVFIKDANGCVGNVLITINQPLVISATSTKVDESCPGAKDGSFVVTPTGGTAPYTYRFGTTGLYTTTNSFNNLKAGRYRVYIKDANNCEGYSISTVLTTLSSICTPSKTSFVKNDITETKAELILSPNPTKYHFKLSLPFTGGQTTIRVLDLNGKVKYNNITKGNQTITFGETFAAGVYIIELIQGNTSKILKGIKIK